MADTISVECQCGAVKGSVATSPRARRLVCYCRYCSAFAKHLGHADALLDEYGGTDILQVTPSQLRITDGTEQLRCLRLSRSGPLRWFTACCKTPVGNTLHKAQVPFVGIPSLFTKSHAGGRARDEALGPVQFKVNAGHIEPPVPGAHPGGPLKLIGQFMGSFAWDMLRGRARPTPFFDATGAPVAQVQPLSKEERTALGLR